MLGMNGGAMTSTESEVSALLERRTKSMRTKDVDQLMSVYAPDVVYFDLVPPLRYTGSAALRERFLDWFGRWTSEIGLETRDLDVMAGGDVAVAHMLIRASGTLTDGREVGYWVRTSNGCRRSNGRWLITHEHVSLPVDMPTGRAVLDLTP
jgi:ketosteroid isomerase-like protein